MQPIITSVLDTDTYKLTMCNAISHLYPHAQVRYAFINRGPARFNDKIIGRLRDQIEMMGDLKLTSEERSFLEKACPFLPPTFLDILSMDHLFDPAHITTLGNQDGNLQLDIEGPWYRTVLWEVPLMAIISELFFEDKLLDYSAARQKAYDKGRQLRSAGAFFSDFGTRRRASKDIQEQVIKGLGSGAGPNLVGTSNVRFAMENNIKPIGTQAHEWFMYHAAKYGFVMANSTALGRWADVYSGQLGIALTDTFTSENFWSAFSHFYAHLFDGVRHDSGNAFDFGGRAIKHYQSLGINPIAKTIVFSDALNVKLACALQKRFHGRIGVAFGIGTHFTNDVGVTPLNMVIKMVAAKPEGVNHWIPAVKLSDDEGKHTGDPSAIQLCKATLGIFS